MMPFLTDHHGDPGRVYAEGHTTRVAIEQSREQLAGAIGARPREVVFTSSGTEAVNAAVFGANERTDHTFATGAPPAHLVTTAVEHSSVIDACRRTRADVSLVGVDKQGRVDPEAVIAGIREHTALVSVQFANHEVGALQPVAEIVAACRERDVLVHLDACAAVGYVPLDFGELGCDLMSITAHKLGGPKGAGALVVRRGLRVAPFIVGGAQERARRGGIENVPAIVGFGAAIEEANAALADEEPRVRALTNRVIHEAIDAVPGVTLFGDRTERLASLVCFGVDGVEAEPILLALDQRGIAVHSGSACSSESLEPSPVLAAMGVDADHSLRLSVGWSTTDTDIDAFVAAFPDVVEQLRALRA